MANGADDGKQFLGVGVAFPLRLERGRIALTAAEELIRQSIEIILRTAKGERVMQPEFGAGLANQLFAPLDPSVAPLVQHEVREALTRFEPRIELLEVNVVVDPGRQGVLLVRLKYRVRQTDAVFNLVYPFYLERGES